jgi:hypothetical protein
MELKCSCSEGCPARLKITENERGLSLTAGQSGWLLNLESIEILSGFLNSYIEQEHARMKKELGL